MDSTFADYPGGERIQTLKHLAVNNRRVLLRVDFNVPLKEGRIQDETRITAALPTIRYLLDNGARLVCASHLGRPKGKFSEEFSLDPVGERLGELLDKDVILADDCVGDNIVRQSKDLRKGQILLLENLRFHPGETENTKEFSFKLSQMAEVFVNDAFGACHRAHSSTVGVTENLREKYAGFLLESEIKALSSIVHKPLRPMYAVLGGAKVSDKVPVIDSLMVKSEKIFIGGAMAYTFLRALQVQVGDSRVEVDQINLAAKILNRAKEASCKIILPVDHRVGASFSHPGEMSVTENAHIAEGQVGLDIGPKTEELFARELKGAETIFWNGPMGVFEKPPFDTGTFYVAKLIAEMPSHVKVVGGGDSVSAVKQSGADEGFTHVSTGGGASLEMIQGLALPGIEALKRKIGN